jgi:1,4-dihydroxy-2-naphthoate octaprenyltransferase
MALSYTALVTRLQYFKYVYLIIKLGNKKKYRVFACIMAAFFACITVFSSSSLLAVWPCVSLGLL